MVVPMAAAAADLCLYWCQLQLWRAEARRSDHCGDIRASATGAAVLRERAVAVCGLNFETGC